MAYTKEEALKRYGPIYSAMKQKIRIEESQQKVQKKLREHPTAIVHLDLSTPQHSAGLPDSEKPECKELFVGNADLSFTGFMTLNPSDECGNSSANKINLTDDEILIEKPRQTIQTECKSAHMRRRNSKLVCGDSDEEEQTENSDERESESVSSLSAASLDDELLGDVKDESSIDTDGALHGEGACQFEECNEKEDVSSDRSKNPQEKEDLFSADGIGRVKEKKRFKW